MKTFVEILENKRTRAENRVYTNPYGESENVPEEKKDYKETVQKELKRLIDPVIKAYDMNVSKIYPNLWLSKGGWGGRQRRADGSMNLKVNSWKLISGNHVIGQFFTEKDALICKKEYEDREIGAATRDNMKVELGDQVGLGLHDLEKLAKKKGINIDIDYIEDFSEQCFYEEGPDWEKFKKNNRGAFASEKFGFK